MANLKNTYEETVVPALREKFGFKNPMEVPRLSKIVVNMAFGIVDKDTQKSVVDDLEKITVPTLIICGDQDPYLNYDLVYAAPERLPEGSALEVIKGASHVAFIEKPYHQDFQ